MDRFRPFAELFYLVAAADGEVDSQERAVMLGAFRALTGGRVRGATLENFESELRDLCLAEGVDSRLEFVCSSLANDRDDKELALTLAAAVALANQHLDDGESQLMEKLARWLGIPPPRMAQLIQSGRESLPPNEA